MKEKEYVTVYYHGDEYDSASDRELKRKRFKHGAVVVIAFQRLARELMQKSI
jgi:hypothetical protein